MSYATPIATPVALKLHSGQLYGVPFGHVSADVVLAANTLVAAPLVVPNSCIFNSIGILSVAGAPGNSIRVGIYADNNGVPGALLLDAGSLAATAADTFVQAAITFTAAPGVYWLAAALHGDASAILGMGEASGAGFSAPFNLPVMNPPSLDSGSYGVQSPLAVPGALPSLFGSPVTPVASVPWVLLGVQ